ncbi:MAG: diacylglycerol/lipid kinase family protein [Streptosporangiaceae bacterium]
MSGQFCLVVNPVAGRGRAVRVLPVAVAALDAAGAACEVTESASLRHAQEVAAAAVQRGDAVVAVGGDGLASALAGVAAAGSGIFGIIPAGRGNDLARVLGIPADPAAAARVLTAGATRQMDLISVSVPGQPDHLVAGSVYLGVPALAGEIANRMHWLGGPMVYPVAALRALAGWKPARFRVEISGNGAAEGSGAVVAGQAVLAGAAAGQADRGGAAREPAVVHELAGYAVVVANSAYFGAGMKVAPPARIDDGVLDIVLMRHGPRLAFLRTLAKIRDGSHVSIAQISLHRGTDVSVTVDRAMPSAADGETLAGAGPLPAGARLRIRVLPAALTVLAPPPGPAR